jgi:hypothetical protein
MCCWCLQGWQLLENGKAEGAVRRHEGVGVAVLRPPRPLHYYSLFSHAIGCDVVVSRADCTAGSWHACASQD